jgi:hypothetical protein
MSRVVYAESVRTVDSMSSPGVPDKEFIEETDYLRSCTETYSFPNQSGD